MRENPNFQADNSLEPSEPNRQNEEWLKNALINGANAGAGMGEDHLSYPPETFMPPKSTTAEKPKQDVLDSFRRGFYSMIGKTSF